VSLGQEMSRASTQGNKYEVNFSNNKKFFKTIYALGIHKIKTATQKFILGGNSGAQAPHTNYYFYVIYSLLVISYQDYKNSRGRRQSVNYFSLLNY
jgi:hypothetical protein